MNYYKLCLIIICTQTLYASDSGFMPPANSPIQSALDATRHFQAQVLARREALAVGSIQQTVVPLSAQLNDIAQGSNSSALASSTLAARATSVVGGDIGRKACILQEDMRAFDRELKVFRTRQEQEDLEIRELEALVGQKKAKQKEELARQQQKFDNLTAEVRRLKGSFSGRPLNDDFGSELAAMLVVIGQANPQLSLNPILRVPSLRLDSSGLSSRASSLFSERFCASEHKSFVESLDKALSSQEHQLSGNRRQPFMLPSHFVDHTIISDSITAAPAAAAAVARTNTDDDDSPIMVAPMRRTHNAAYNDGDEADDEASPLSTSQVLGDNCGGISQMVKEVPEAVASSPRKKNERRVSFGSAKNVDDLLDYL